jgi:Lipopolysaccharide-assembly
MILKNKWLILGLMLMCFVTSCGVYSFTGAAIEGRTINIHFIENNARTVVPSLSATLTEKLRQRILSQSSLSQVNNDMTDYDVSGAIIGYDVTVASVTGKETSLLNRLTITVSITFKNKLNEKANFIQSFSRFVDFSSDQNIQNVEVKLISEISDQLADDIFNKAFVNW